MRWPVDLLAEVDAAVEKGGRTAFVLDAVRDQLATRYGAASGRLASRSAPSSEAPEPEPPPIEHPLHPPEPWLGDAIPDKVKDVKAALAKSREQRSSGREPQGPTCKKCGGLATYEKGKARCMAGCKR